MNKDINLQQICIDADLYVRNKRVAKESERESSPAPVQQEVNFVSNGFNNKKGKGGGKGKSHGRRGNNVRGGYSSDYNQVNQESGNYGPPRQQDGGGYNNAGAQGGSGYNNQGQQGGYQGQGYQGQAQQQQQNRYQIQGGQRGQETYMRGEYRGGGGVGMRLIHLWVDDTIARRI